MTKVKTGINTRKRHKKIIRFNKGYRGSNSKLFKTANQVSMKSFLYAYNDRRKRKNMFRKLWIKQINNYLQVHPIKYNVFIKKLKENKVELNRKILSKIFILDNKTLINYLIK